MPRAPLLGLCLALALASRGLAQSADTVPPPPPPRRSDGPARPVRGAPPPRRGAGALDERSAVAADCSADFLATLDATDWRLWWHYNRHTLLDLKARLYATGCEAGDPAFFLGRGDRLLQAELMRPSAHQVHGEVAPALLETLVRSSNPVLQRAALLAIARIGAPPDDDRALHLLRAIEAYLSASNGAVAEAAATALGVFGSPAGVPALATLVRDDAQGHGLVDGTRVPTRLRAFAAFGLGAIGRRAPTNAVRRQIVELLIDILEAPRLATHDVKVAAMISLGMVPLDWSLDASGLTHDPARVNRKHALSRRTQLEFLLDAFDPERQRESGNHHHWLVRAHAATAIGRLCDGAPEGVRDRAATLLLASIARHTTEPDEVRQSCVLALGDLGDADTRPGSIDARIRSELLRVMHEGDAQSRRFALIALARSGSRAGQHEQPYRGLEPTREALLESLIRGPSRIKPWAALALGVMAHTLAETDQPIPPRTLRALQRTCGKSRGPADSGAYLLALGLAGDTASAELLASKLDFFQGSDGPRGSAAIALGLLGGTSTIVPLRDALDDATSRPALYENLAIGLGLCGDGRTVPHLVHEFAAATASSGQMSAARALTQVGDSRAIPALVEWLRDESSTDDVRAAIATALGSICAADRLPWTVYISTGLNYRATTATLRGAQGPGVLDTL